MSHAFLVSPNENARRDLALANAHLGLMYMRMGEYRAANVFFEAAEEAGLAGAALLNNYAASLAYEGRLNEAHAAFNRAHDLAPEDRIISNNIAKLQQMAGAPDFLTEEISTEFVPPPSLQEYHPVAA